MDNDPTTTAALTPFRNVAMKEVLLITAQSVVVTTIVLALVFGLGAIVAGAEAGRNLLLNVATGLVIWWMITMLQDMRDAGRTCDV